MGGHFSALIKPTQPYHETPTRFENPSFQVAPMTNKPTPQRKIVGRLSIVAGNVLQLAGIASADLSLALARSASSKPIAIVAMISAWVLLYFFCHGIAHWAVGRLVGIHFAFYTIGGTGNPEAYPAGLRWVFEHLPFFGVQTEKASMQAASPRQRRSCGPRE